MKSRFDPRGRLGHRRLLCVALAAGISSVACNRPTGETDVERRAGALTAPRPAADRSGPRSVTLISGDRVVLGGGTADAVTILRAKGRERVRFTTSRLAPRPGDPQHLYVIPEDALPLIASEKVDRRLFDVTLLLDYRYDDAHRDSLPLMVTYASGTGRRTAAPSQRALAGAATRRQLPSINGLAAVAGKAQINDVWAEVASGQTAASTSRALAATREPIAKLWLDGLRWPVLDRSVPQIGAPSAWARGYRGEGVRVAVLDSGVDGSHPDLVDRLVASRNFTVDPDGDQVGHGTHVASIIAGTGAVSDGRYRGVAPRAELVSGKVCMTFGCLESDVVAGMEWAAAESGARVVNLSIGGPDLPGLDPLEEAVNTLTAQSGVLFVIAAGNDGASAGSVDSPGSAEAALTVGAVDRVEEVLSFSGRGPTAGDYSVKPDVTAPGFEIVAARADGTALGSPVGDAYVKLSGTSMATPHVAGAAALLAEEHPDWGAGEIKGAIMASASFSPHAGVFDQGAGRVDVSRAIATTLIAEPPSVGFGIAAWPHEDDVPLTHAITYRNLGPATQLAFALDVRGPTGQAAPEGMFTVSPAAVTLGAGETVSVTVTANTRVSAPDGTYGGRLQAMAATGSTVAVPLAVSREIESYDLALRYADRAGSPPVLFRTIVVGIDFPYSTIIETVTPDGATTVRLPRGHYLFDTIAFGLDGTTSWFVAPNQSLVTNGSLVFDSRLASTLTVRPPKPGLDNAGVTEYYGLQNLFDASLSVQADGDGFAYYLQEIGPSAPGLLSGVTAQWLDPTCTPQDFYAFAWSGRGRLPVVASTPVDRRDMAMVHARYGVPPYSTPDPPLRLTFVGATAWTGSWLGGASSAPMFDLPLARTEYYFSQDPAVQWAQETFILELRDAPFMFAQGSVPAKYRAGRTYSSTSNLPPYSLSLPERNPVYDWAFRQADALAFWIPAYGDREGHAGYGAGPGNMVLFRNGEKFGESGSASDGYFVVPSDPADYRLELTASQSMFRLTTHEDVVWTFRSARPTGPGSEALPLLAVRFAPDLNAQGEAPRSPHFRLPLSVLRYGETDDKSVPPRLSKPSVEVSYDDGVTWNAARVDGEGRSFIASYDHPGHAGYVSLRLGTHDTAGNSVKQTVIRAYVLPGRP